MAAFDAAKPSLLASTQPAKFILTFDDAAFVKLLVNIKGIHTVFSYRFARNAEFDVLNVNLFSTRY